MEIEKQKCRHRWLRKFLESKNALGNLALFEVWYCGKCKLETTGEFKGTIKQSKENAKLEKRISPREIRIKQKENGKRIDNANPKRIY